MRVRAPDMHDPIRSEHLLRRRRVAAASGQQREQRGNRRTVGTGLPEQLGGGSGVS